MLGGYNCLADKPLSMCLRMFPERRNGSQKAHPECGNSIPHPMGWGLGLNTNEVNWAQHSSLLPDWVSCDQLPHTPLMPSPL